MSVQEKAYEELLCALTAANKKIFGKGFVGEMEAVMAIVKYLEALGAPSEAISPFAALILTLAESAWSGHVEGKSGPKGRRLGEQGALAAASAAVTVLKTRRSCHVDAAVKDVASVTGIPGNEIRKFRDSLHRGTTNKTADMKYQADITKLSEASDSEIGEYLKLTRKLYRLYL